MLIGRKLKGFTRDEKRRDRRTPVALPMQVGSARATMTDISLGGFAFEADSGRVRPGAAFTATVQLEDGTALEVEARSEEHTSELQSLMRISYAVFCLKKKKEKNKQQ